MARIDWGLERAMDDKSPSTYDADFLVWSEQQAQALRELAKNRALLPNARSEEHTSELQSH